MELQIKKDFESALLQRIDEIGAFLIKQGHADLKPFSLTGKHISQLKSSTAFAIKCNDNAILAGHAVEI